MRGRGIDPLRSRRRCGPGTWITRIAAYAHRLGLVVEAVGFDISAGQLMIARGQTEKFAVKCPKDKGKLDFLIHDLADPLPWSNGHFHIVLCNYVVLNHLPPRTLPQVASRVANFRVIATVRAFASPATGCIIGIEHLREYHRDCTRGELKLVLMNGTEHLRSLNLFSAATLEALFAPHATVMDVRAIDLFLSRFVPDTKWTAILFNGITGRDEVMRKLKELEEPLCRQPGWVDHGTHVLIVAQPNGHG